MRSPLHLAFVSLVLFLGTPVASAALVMVGVFDIPEGDVRGVQLLVTADIPDLSVYGVATDMDATDPDPVEWIFNAADHTVGGPLNAALEGQTIILLRNGRLDEFTDFFGASFTPDHVYESDVFNNDGKGSVALYTDLIDTKGDGKVGDYTGTVTDAFGVLGANGSDTAWDFRDGWVYRNPADGPNPLFDFDSGWTASGRDGLDGYTTNEEAIVAGIGVPIPEPSSSFLVVLGGLLALSRRGRNKRG